MGIAKKMTTHPPKFDMSGSVLWQNCVEWELSCDRYGYGQVMITVAPKQRRLMRVHRAAWVAIFGEIPPEVHLLHRCDNPPCYNLKHLFIGDQAGNMVDKIRKGRQPIAYKFKEREGPLTAEEMQEAEKLIAQGLSQAVVGNIFNVSRSYIAKRFRISALR